MSLPKYLDTKDSGVDWLGEVPSHWDVAVIKHIVSTPVADGPHETPEFVDEGIPFVSAEAVSSGKIDFTKIRGFISQEDHERYCQKYKPQLGDIYMVKSGASTGTTAIVEDDREFSIWSPLAAIRCDEHSDPRYILNFLRSRHFQEGVTLNWSFGTQQNIGMNVIENLQVTRPPLEEQKSIASFLDVETSKIDGLVSEQRRLIELLKEKRQAVISHAVTKGLNPNAPIKPSGIQWLGDVPEHWEVVPIKHLCSLLKDGTHLPPSRVDDGIPLLSVRNLVDGAFVLRDDDSMISQESYEDLCRAFVPAAGDVLLAIVGATLGKTAVIPDGLGDFQIQRSVGIFRPHPKRLAGMFLNLVFQSSQFQSKLWELVGYSAQPGIYLGTLQNLRVPVPPEKEQADIVASTTKKAGRLSELLAEAKRAIELLQERRTALISAAVTGKIDVRGFAYQERA